MTTAVPITASLPLRTVTVAPGSPVPVTIVPLGFIAPVGAAGGVVSGACAVVEGETLPAGSVWVTVTVWPLFWGWVSVTV